METCYHCGCRGNSEVIRRCSRCKSVRYCSRECQSRDWSRHKVRCRDVDTDEVASVTEMAAPPRQADHTAAPAASPASSSPFGKMDSGDAMGTMAKPACSSCTVFSCCSEQCEIAKRKDKLKRLTENTVLLKLAQQTAASAVSPHSSAQQQRSDGWWAGIFGTPELVSWEVARSRAMAAFPGNLVTDDVHDLNIPFVEYCKERVDVPCMPIELTSVLPHVLQTESLLQRQDRWLDYFNLDKPDGSTFSEGYSKDVLVVKPVRCIVLPAALPIYGWVVEDHTGYLRQLFFDVKLTCVTDVRDIDPTGRYLCVRHPKVLVYKRPFDTFREMPPCVFIVIEELGQLKLL